MSAAPRVALAVVYDRDATEGTYAGAQRLRRAVRPGRDPDPARSDCRGRSSGHAPRHPAPLRASRHRGHTSVEPDVPRAGRTARLVYRQCLQRYTRSDRRRSAVHLCELRVANTDLSRVLQGQGAGLHVIGDAYAPRTRWRRPRHGVTRSGHSEGLIHASRGLIFQAPKMTSWRHFHGVAGAPRRAPPAEISPLTRCRDSGCATGRIVSLPKPARTTSARRSRREKRRNGARCCSRRPSPGRRNNTGPSSAAGGNSMCTMTPPGFKTRQRFLEYPPSHADGVLVQKEARTHDVEGIVREIQLLRILLRVMDPHVQRLRPRVA